MNTTFEPLAPGTRLREWIIGKDFGGDRRQTFVYHAARSEPAGTAVIKEYAAARFTLSADVGIDSRVVRQGLRRFATDAHLLSSLLVPNLVPGLVAIRDLLKANDTVYAVMDFEAGTLLSELLSRGERADEAWLSARLREIAGGLAAAHNIGVLHRAIKPADIIIAPEGAATLVGFCSSHTGADSTVDRAYVSPEQQAGDQAVGPWSDIFALGAVFRWCITGAAHGGRRKALTDGDWPGFSRRFLAAIDAATATSPEQRPQTVASWLEQFPRMSPDATRQDARSICVGLNTSTSSMLGNDVQQRPPSLPDNSEATSIEDDRRDIRPDRDRLPRARRLLLAAVGALLLIVLGIALALRIGQREPTGFDTTALELDLRRSNTTLSVIDNALLQATNDGVAEKETRSARDAAARARQALAVQQSARLKLAHGSGDDRPALLAEFRRASAALTQEELAALQRTIAAYDEDVALRSSGVDDVVTEARIALDGMLGGVGSGVAANIDQIWPVFTRSRAELRQVMVKRLSATSVAQTQPLLREAIRAHQNCREALISLDRLVADASRVIVRDRVDDQTYRGEGSALARAVERSRATAGEIARLTKSRARDADPSLVALASAAKRRAGLTTPGEHSQSDLSALRAALAQARVDKAILQAMATRVRRLPRVPTGARANTSPTAVDTTPLRPSALVVASPDGLKSAATLREIFRQTARELDITSDHYRHLRRELSRTYKARGAEPVQNARNFADADRVYKQLLDLRELERIVRTRENANEAEFSYRKFNEERVRLEARIEQIERSMSERR